MDVYEAIRRMRDLSKAGKSFSFSFMSYSYERNKSHGVVEVQNARLISQDVKEKGRFADIMLNYIDLDTLEYGRCYQILLLSFNDDELELR